MPAASTAMARTPQRVRSVARGRAQQGVLILPT
jgi:hypothetical protein